MFDTAPCAPQHLNTLVNFSFGASNAHNMKVDSEQFRVQPGQCVDLLRRATTVAPLCRSERHDVMSGVNPPGCEVFSFKHPSPQQLQQDFLWRTTRELPERGRIGIWLDRYRSIVNLEQHLHLNGTRIIQFFLHMSKEEQSKRLHAGLRPVPGLHQQRRFALVCGAGR